MPPVLTLLFVLMPVVPAIPAIPVAPPERVPVVGLPTPVGKPTNVRPYKPKTPPPAERR